MTRKLLIPATVACLLGGAASQSIGQGVMIERAIAAPARQEGLVRVQMSIQLFVMGPTDESEAADRHRERARRVLYELAAKECDLMRDVIARDCRLESINVNLNRQMTPQMQGYAVNGSMAYQITLK